MDLAQVFFKKFIGSYSDIFLMHREYNSSHKKSQPSILTRLTLLKTIHFRIVADVC